MKINVSTYSIKYNEIEYCEGFILLIQNRIRRRIPNGYYFEDTGSHIYISQGYAHLFQHGQKRKDFIVDTDTKEWEYAVKITSHIPERMGKLDSNIIDSLKR